MLQCSSSYVQRWRERFLASRLAGLVAVIKVARCGRCRQAGGAHFGMDAPWPQDGTTTGAVAVGRGAGHHHMTVARVWRGTACSLTVAPLHAQRGSDFEKKAADIIGLYLNPPDHAAVFCSTKDGYPGLGPLDPVLPLSPAEPRPRL